MFTNTEKQIAMWMHIAIIVMTLFTSWLAGFAGTLTALAVYLIQPIHKDSQFIRNHAKEAFNFNVSMFLYAIVGLIVGFIFVVLTFGLGVIVALPIIFAFYIYWIWVSVIATLKASKGEYYKFPLTIPFLK